MCVLEERDRKEERQHLCVYMGMPSVLFLVIIQYGCGECSEYREFGEDSEYIE